MVSPVDLIAGALTLLPLIIGYSMGIITFKLYMEKRVNLLLLTSILFFSLPSPWLGVSTVFVMKLLGLTLISDRTYVFIYAWSVPIIVTTWNFSAASLLKWRDWVKWLVLGLTVIVDILFLYSIYILEEFEVNTVDGSIFLDSTFTGLANITSTIIVISVLLFVAPLFLWISINTEDELFKFKSRFISIGGFLFSLSAGLDATISLSDILLVLFIRLALVISIICLYLGYITPDFVKKRYQ